MNSIFRFATILIITNCFSVSKSFAQTPSNDPVSFNLQNTRWELIYTIEGKGNRDFDIICHPNGKLENFHPSDNTAHDDLWKQKGRKITFILNGGYAHYKGEIIDHDTIEGKGHSRNGLHWKWKAIRRTQIS